MKLLLAIIAAVIVGIVLDSWVWGIATFIILMFIFIWVASWIFGGSIKGKVKVDDELKELLDKLHEIGSIKNQLPNKSRDWFNSLGLYVQKREMGDLIRLQAGDKLHFRIDAWLDDIFSDDWKVKKYQAGDWENLVDPTLEIAHWLRIHGGLPKEYEYSFDRAIQLFNKEGHLELPGVVR